MNEPTLHEKLVAEALSTIDRILSVSRVMGFNRDLSILNLQKVTNENYLNLVHSAESNYELMLAYEIKCQAEVM